MIEFGDILFFKGESVVDKVIQYFTKSKYSHVLIALDSFHVVEGTLKGVKINHINFSINQYDIYKVDIDSDRLIDIKTFLMNKINSPYEYYTIVDYILTKYIRMNIKIQNNPNKYICSEFIYEIYKAVGIDLLDSYDMKDKIITPQGLLESKYLIKK